MTEWKPILMVQLFFHSISRPDCQLNSTPILQDQELTLSCLCPLTIIESPVWDKLFCIVRWVMEEHMRRITSRCNLVVTTSMTIKLDLSRGVRCRCFVSWVTYWLTCYSARNLCFLTSCSFGSFRDYNCFLHKETVTELWKQINAFPKYFKMTGVD